MASALAAVGNVLVTQTSKNRASSISIFALPVQVLVETVVKNRLIQLIPLSPG
jgi:hypothetical protein